MEAASKQQVHVIKYPFSLVLLHFTFPMTLKDIDAIFCPGIKLHQIRLFPSLFTHHNLQLPSEKRILQISKN